MEKNALRKEVYKTPHMAKFSHFRDGKIYYDMMLDAYYRLGMNTSDEDMKGADFSEQIEPKFLWRWINKGVDNGDFVKLSA